jgi:predicted MPP superfamily phosphohydrolase
MIERSASGDRHRMVETDWLRRWLIALDLGLLLAAVVLGLWVTRRAFFLVVLVPVAFVPFSYARLRLARMLASHADGSAYVGSFAHLFAFTGVACDLVMVAQLLTGRAPDSLPFLQAGVVSWIGPVWFSAHMMLFLGYATVGVLRALRRVATRAATSIHALVGASIEGGPPVVAAPRATGPESPERRAFLQRAALAGAGMPFFVSLSGVPLSYDFRVEEREIPLPGWPRELDGLRVVHLSDIHVGGGMNRERLLRIAELVNGARPDLVAHTGDFLTHRSGDFDTPLYQALARVRAPHGQWACLGNHDVDDPPRLVERLAGAGVTVLRDRLAQLEIARQPIEIAGLDFVFDRGARAARYAGLVDRLGPRTEIPRLLLNHDPSGFVALPDACADLVLSGHTHGGHVGIQLGREHALTVVGLLGLPDQGLFTRPGMQMFVTRCVGFYGYPMRVGIPPQIAVLVLRTPRVGAGAGASNPI